MINYQHHLMKDPKSGWRCIELIVIWPPLMGRGNYTKTVQDKTKTQFQMLSQANMTNLWLRSSMATSKLPISCKYWTLPAPKFTLPLWEVDFQNSFFCNSDCRFRFVSKKCLLELFSFFKSSSRNMIKNAKNWQ